MKRIFPSLRAVAKWPRVHSATSKTVHPSAIVRCNKARGVETASRDAARDRRHSGTD